VPPQQLGERGLIERRGVALQQLGVGAGARPGTDPAQPMNHLNQRSRSHEDPHADSHLS